MLHKEFPQIPVITISALSGQGVDAWLDFVLQERSAGVRITDVDYDEYAAGEAALGWLNAAVRLEASHPVDWRHFCLELMQALQREFQGQSAEIAHLKLHLTAGDESLTANLTSSHGVPLLRGTITGQPRKGVLLVNARAHIAPEPLRTLVERQLQAAGDGLQLTIEALQSFAPSRPQPLHRYNSVVS
jgi:hypothetical protein